MGKIENPALHPLQNSFQESQTNLQDNPLFTQAGVPPMLVFGP
jgi:hypothetical protein